MRQIYAFRKLLLVTLLGAASAVNGQVHPLAFGIVGSATTTNWYKDYVGLRFEVISPAIVAGDKQYTTSNDGSGATGAWGTSVTISIVNTPVVMPQGPGTAPDSLCIPGVTITNSMAGKIGLVYRGGSVEFGAKALACQTAGAIACVIVNNIPGGPIGMGAGASGASVHIPVFMISQADGNAMDAQYNQGNIPSMTITSWGLGNKNDLGFVPDGIALWHAYAIPSNQLAASNPAPYKMLPGAFIANYGTSDAKNVKVKDSLSFVSAEGGAPVVIHNSVGPNLPTFTGLAQAIPANRDSIYAMFSSTSYDIGNPGKGQFNLTYTITSDSVDQYTGDNTATASFYTTDSLYSKGRYDFTANAPISTTFESFGGSTGAEYVWGPMYFVAKGGAAVSRIQYSILYSNGTTTPPKDFPSGSNNVYLFKWSDANSDGLVQDGELGLVGSAQKNYTLGVDTSGAILSVNMYSDTTLTAPHVFPYLTDNSWYYVAVDLPSSGAGSGYFLGCDGIGDPLPRGYGRRYSVDSIVDYSSIVVPGPESALWPNPTNPNFPSPAPGGVSFVNALDSFSYANAKGLIPSVAMIVNNAPDTSHLHDAVTNVSKSYGTVVLSPNPAKDYLNVSVQLENSSTVTYTIIDGLARFVSKESHSNVKDEVYTINTANMPSGNYFLVVNVNDRVISKKFVVIK